MTCHFGDESFQAIDCTGFVGVSEWGAQWNKTLYTLYTQKTNRETCRSKQSNLSPGLACVLRPPARKLELGCILHWVVMYRDNAPDDIHGTQCVAEPLLVLWCWDGCVVAWPAWCTTVYNSYLMHCCAVLMYGSSWIMTSSCADCQCSIAHYST